MLDDLMDFLTFMVKSFGSRGIKQAEIAQQYRDVDFRINVRRAAFWNLLGFLILVPFVVYGTFIFYPMAKHWWDWKYWRVLTFLSVSLYFVAVTLTPRVNRAKYVYILRTFYFVPISAFLLSLDKY